MTAASRLALLSEMETEPGQWKCIFCKNNNSLSWQTHRMHQYYSAELGMAIPGCLSFGTVARSILSQNHISSQTHPSPVISSSNTLLPKPPVLERQSNRPNPPFPQYPSLNSRDIVDLGGNDIYKRKSRYYDEDCIDDRDTSRSERKNKYDSENFQMSNLSSFPNGPMVHPTVLNTRNECKPGQFNIDTAKTQSKTDWSTENNGFNNIPGNLSGGGNIFGNNKEEPKQIHNHPTQNIFQPETRSEQQTQNLKFSSSQHRGTTQAT